MLSTYYGLNKFSKIDKNNCNSITGAQHYKSSQQQQNIESILHTTTQTPNSFMDRKQREIQ